MNDRLVVAREAMRAAFQLRRSLSLPREQPANAFDAAEAVGIEVRFIDAPSLEGMFSRAPHPIILVPSLNHRPRGRVAFSCAHELGHAQLNHGTQVDKYLAERERQNEPEELAANVFASSLLMPRPAVLSCFQRRSCDIASAQPAMLYAIACELGVGYQTLLKHIRWGLQLSDGAWLAERAKVTPKLIRAYVLGQDSLKSLLVVDDAWRARFVDLEIGESLTMTADHKLLSHSAHALLSEADMHGKWRTYRADRAGRCELFLDNHSIELRIARQGYVGPYKHRYLDDPESI